MSWRVFLLVEARDRSGRRFGIWQQIAGVARRMRPTDVFPLVLLALLLAAPAVGQDLPPGDWTLPIGADQIRSLPISADQSAPDTDPGAGVVAAGWCAIHTGDEDQDAPGCDLGVGVALYRARRLAVVAAIGTETLGGGLAWVAHRGGDGRPTIAVSLGVVARYDERGVDASSLAPAVGATFGFGGRR